MRAQPPFCTCAALRAVCTCAYACLCGCVPRCCGSDRLRAAIVRVCEVAAACRRCEFLRTAIAAVLLRGTLACTPSLCRTRTAALTLRGRRDRLETVTLYDTRRGSLGHLRCR